MDKNIIIDGVDVAGCKYHDDGICCNDDVLTLSCEKTNCMFKQLKRLEQENKQMKSALEEIREIVSDEIDKTDSDDELMQIYGTIYNRINEVLQ